MYRVFKYFIVIVGVLLLLTLTPRLIDFEKYKDLIISQARESTGRDLAIDGKISLSLLPRPKITVHDIRLLSSHEASTPNLVEIKSAEAAIAISPLFLGKIVISYIHLISPTVTFEKLKDGTNTWSYNTSLSKNTKPSTEVDFKSFDITKLPFEIRAVLLEQGKIIYIDGVDKKVFDSLDCDIKLEDYLGPISFNLTFNVLEQNIELNGKIKEISNIIPLVVELNALGEKIQLSGSIDISNSSFQGNISSNGNFKSLKLLSSEALPAGLKEDYKFSAKVNLDKQKLNVEDIYFQMDKLSAKGDAQYILKEGSGAFDLAIEPGKIIINALSEGYKNSYLATKIKLQVNSIEPFLEALKIEFKALPRVLSQVFSIETELKYKDQELLLKNFNCVIGKSNIQGLISAQNLGQEPIFFYDIKTKNIDDLVNLNGSDLPIILGDLQIKGEASKNNKTIKTNTNITLATSDIRVKGNVLIDQDVKPDIIISAKGPNLSKTIQQLTARPFSMELGNFDINAKVSSNSSNRLAIELSKSSLAYGSQENIGLSGTCEIKLDSKKPKISMNFLASILNLDKLTDVSAKSSKNVKRSISAHSADFSQSNWSKEKIDLSFLNSFNGDLNLLIQKITSGNLVFDNFKVASSLNDGTVDISSFSGNLYGGKVEGVAKIIAKRDGDADISLKTTLNGGQLRNIYPSHEKIRITQGVIYCNVDIKTKGENQYSYVKNLNGNMTLNAKDGRLSGLDLQKIVSTLNNAKNLQGVIQSLDNSFMRGETKFKTIENKITIDSGVVNLATSKVLADGCEINASGTVDLLKYLLNVTAEIKVDIKNIPPFKAHLYGDIDNPQYKLDFNELKQYLINNVLTNVIDSIKKGEKAPADILKNIINKRSNEEALNSTPSVNQNKDDIQTSPKNEINKLINKSLKGLFK